MKNEFEKLELLKARLECLKESVINNSHISTDWVMKNIFGFSKKEIADLKNKKL